MARVKKVTFPCALIFSLFYGKPDQENISTQYFEKKATTNYLSTNVLWSRRQWIFENVSFIGSNIRTISTNCLLWFFLLIRKRSELSNKKNETNNNDVVSILLSFHPNVIEENMKFRYFNNGSFVLLLLFAEYEGNLCKLIRKVKSVRNYKTYLTKYQLQMTIVPQATN